jgi:hypothetical protein
VCVCVQWSLGKKNKEKWRSPSLSRRPLWWVSAIKFICSVQHFLSLFFFNLGFPLTTERHKTNSWPRVYV